MSRVVRVGATVRRSAGPWSPTLQRLLAHVRAGGVHWVPEPLGFDEAGREVLSYVPGVVPHEMPDWIWSERVLTDVTRALRQWHDATLDFDGNGAVWGVHAREPCEVIGHNDFAPYNCVFADGRFVGAIDFDRCSPGPRLWDIVYTAYRFVPLMPPRGTPEGNAFAESSPFDVPEMRKRLRLLLDAYAGSSEELRYPPSRALIVVVERLRALADFTAAHWAQSGDSALVGHAAMYSAHAAWLEHIEGARSTDLSG